MSAPSPSLERTPWLERRASIISDPVDRLRYLRRQMQPPAARPRKMKIAVRNVGWLALAVLVLGMARPPAEKPATIELERRLVLPGVSAAGVPFVIPHVWRVERNGEFELYSNGLRIELAFAVSNRSRAHYPIFPLAGGKTPTRTGNTPVGIVYHTTESHLAPFEEDENRRLQRLGQNLLELIRHEHSYHYVIDRFGRAFRVVEESDAANHSGHSVWADTEGIYVNLNDSFLGISFEGQTGEVEAVTPAQISAAKALTEMLRSKYRIAAESCVTHAQVSVNPLNMHIGLHTDWASGFPFSGMGLADNYSLPMASMYAFGFEYDPVFLRMCGRRWPGLDSAEEQVKRQAAAEGIPVARYRAILQHRYKDIAAALREEN